MRQIVQAMGQSTNSLSGGGLVGGVGTGVTEAVSGQETVVLVNVSNN
jgi:hypothetical protein